MIPDEPAILFALVVLAGVLGLLVGSFLNVVIWRVPKGKSIRYPGSACPNCGHAIRWWDNIPVVSWLILRGRCRDCAAPISRRYPLVELVTGLFFAGVAGWLLATLAPRVSLPALVFAALAYLFLAAISVALALIDLDTHTLPNVIVLPAYVVGALLLGVSSVISGDLGALLRAGLAMVAMLVAYLAMALAYKGGMGLGDVKLAGMLGLFLGWLGWGSLLVGAFAAFLLGGLFAVILLVLRRANRKSGIPFGPWMLLGAWGGVFFGEGIWSSYLALFGLGI